MTACGKRSSSLPSSSITIRLAQQVDQERRARIAAERRVSALRAILAQHRKAAAGPVTPE